MHSKSISTNVVYSLHTLGKKTFHKPYLSLFQVSINTSSEFQRTCCVATDITMWTCGYRTMPILCFQVTIVMSLHFGTEYIRVPSPYLYYGWFSYIRIFSVHSLIESAMSVHTHCRLLHNSQSTHVFCNEILTAYHSTYPSTGTRIPLVYYICSLEPLIM